MRPRQFPGNAGDEHTSPGIYQFVLNDTGITASRQVLVQLTLGANDSP